jgi:hypothetical protein
VTRSIGDASCGSGDHSGRPAEHVCDPPRRSVGSVALAATMSSEHHGTGPAAHWTRVAVGAPPEIRIVREQRAGLGLALIVQSL